MPKGPVETPITDQEIAFAHLILEGKLTDREAAEAVGISPGQAAYVKGKPRVREYMDSHRASVRAGLVQHEVDALAEFNIGREQIVAYDPFKESEMCMKVKCAVLYTLGWACGNKLSLAERYCKGFPEG